MAARGRAAGGRATQPDEVTAAPSRWSGPDLLLLGLTAVAVWFGTGRALRLWWVSDDAYISFRYADHLVRGLGLIFNVGERVEGYSNFLWTLWCALGLRLGYEAEVWAIASGVVCYGATIVALGASTWLRRREPDALLLPVAALLAAVHRDWAIFSASGLETAAITLLAVLAYLSLVRARGRAGGCAVAGGILALAALMRPDGILFGATGGLFVLWSGRPRLRATLAYAVPLILVLLPYAVWKLWYYGNLLPNTYYAKSAALAWYSQGWIYLRVYLQKYWVLAVGPLLALLAATSGHRSRRVADARAPREESTWAEATALAAAFAAVHTFYVVRVGGDFMFARFLIPATPFFMLLLELGLGRWLAGRSVPALTATAAAVAAIALMPYPFPRAGGVSGIINEYEYYPPQERLESRQLGLALRRALDGLPARAAMTGGQAILAYYSRLPVVIETSSGITDSAIAHQPLLRRGRVGHEKPASLHYLIDVRRVHLLFALWSYFPDTLEPYIPFEEVRIGDHSMTALNWDPEIMGALRRSGAYVGDFEGELDRYLRLLPTLPDSTVRADYARLRRFYFASVRDSARERPFLRRLDTQSPRAPALLPGLTPAGRFRP